MIKGCQKKIIQIKDTKSPFFEEAYFVLKNDTAYTKSIDIVNEATSIINGYSIKDVDKRCCVTRYSKLIFLFLGAMLGATVMSVIYFLLI